MTNTEYQNELERILRKYRDECFSIRDELYQNHVDVSAKLLPGMNTKAKASITALNARRADISKVDRLEVVDDTGRAYVKGSIYETGVKVELDYQDDGRTLKVFVKERA